MHRTHIHHIRVLKLLHYKVVLVEINNLIKALTKPYCGASFFNNKKIYKVFRSEIIADNNKKYENLEYGKIINVSRNFIIVKCGSGLIKLKNIVPKISVKKGEYL